MTAPAVVEHRYRPRGAAKRLLACRDPEVLLSGPAGTGKSRACLEKLHLMCLLNPGMRGLIVRKTQVSMTNTALVTFREHVAAESIAAGHVRWFGGSQQEAACYRYTNGSVINVGGMDKPTKIMSSEYDIVYVQEAIELTETDWEAITTRLRNGKVSFQQIIADTNPDTATHWLKKRCDKGVTRMIESRHEDNPVLVREDGTRTEVGEAYISKLDALTGVRRLRLKDGLWVAAEGQIYEDWTPAIHHVDRFDIPDDWTRWWSVDFGFTNPFVLQCWAEDHDGRLYLYREIYRTRRLVEDHAKDILRIVAPERKWREPRPRAVICDHDAEDRATLERHLGLGTVAAKKTVSDGIQAVQARLRPAGDGKPRLFLLRDSLVERDSDLEAVAKPLSTVDEIPGYVWDVSEGKPPKETPVKENDHGVDALRYMVAERDLGGRPRVRFLGG
ncbi:phage terminase large subunit [Amycolatopsis sp. NPDC006125]|uniref:phage terminase large subunit n=1 Tax=Amycolatopsis sp. NPDC006125 TaxID=3156730 RepID=UPI0033A61AB0